MTLAAYGRPGLYVRATGDPGAASWGPRSALVAPGTLMQDTCSYAGLVALDDQTALIVYSDFHRPDAKGVKRKTILARTVTARRAR